MKTLNELIEDLKEITANPTEGDYENEGYYLAKDTLHYLMEYQEHMKWHAYEEHCLDNEKKTVQEKKAEFDEVLTDYVALNQYWAEQQKNPMLTWDELKNMKAKPVWFTDKSSPYITVTSWMLIHYFYVTSTGVEGIFAHDFTGGTAEIINKDYGEGKTWQAYRKERG